MAKYLNHGVKRTAAAMMALLLASGTIPMQPVADVFRNVSLSVSAEGTEQENHDITVEVRCPNEDDVVKIFTSVNMAEDEEILPEEDGTFTLRKGTYYIVSTCYLQADENSSNYTYDAAKVNYKNRTGVEYQYGSEFTIEDTATSKVVLSHEHFYYTKVSEDKASLLTMCGRETDNEYHEIASFDMENYKEGDTQLGLKYSYRADELIDKNNVIIKYYDSAKKEIDGISGVGVTTVKAYIPVNKETYTIEMIVKGELPSAGDFTFNNTSGEYTGKTLTIEDMGLEGKTDAAKAMLADENTKATVTAYQSYDQGVTFVEAEAKNVGGYKVKVTLENDKYTDTPLELESNYMITARTLTISVDLENSDSEFTEMIGWGKLPELSIRVENFAEGESFEDFGINIYDYLSYSDGFDPSDGTKNDVGSYYIGIDTTLMNKIQEKARNYGGFHVKSLKLNVRQKDITEDMIHLDREMYIYDGEAHTPEVTVSMPVDKIVDGKKVTEEYTLKKGTSLDNDIDYYVDAVDSMLTKTDVGTYYIYVSGKGNFSSNVYNTVYKQWKIVDQMSVVNSAQVLFGGNFGLRYYITPSKSIASDKNAYVKIEKNNKPVKTIKLSEMDKTDDGKLTFEYRVVAKEICDNITVTLYNGYGYRPAFSTDSGIDCTNKGFVYSIKDYANAILSMSDQAKYHELAKALIDYGNAVQIGLGYDSPDNSKPAVSDDVANIDLSGLKEYAHERTGELADYDLTQIGPNVKYLDTTNYRVNYTFNKAVDFSEYTVTVNGEQVEAKSANGAASSANWYVEVESIQGKNYDKEYEVKLTKKGVETPLVLKASVLSYAKLLTEQASAAYKTLGKGMYSYYLAEKRTFNS